MRGLATPPVNVYEGNVDLLRVCPRDGDGQAQLARRGVR